MSVIAESDSNGIDTHGQQLMTSVMIAVAFSSASAISVESACGVCTRARRKEPPHAHTANKQNGERASLRSNKNETSKASVNKHVESEDNDVVESESIDHDCWSTKSATSIDSAECVREAAC